MVTALASTAALGAWQYSVAHRDDVAREVLAANPVDLSELHRVGDYVHEQTYGRLVSAHGRLDCDRGLRVRLSDMSSTWIVCPLMFDGGTSIAVVLGESSTNAALPAIVEEVSVVGRLQPAQDTSQLSPMYQTTPDVPYLNTDELVLRWRMDVFDGYLVATRISEDGRPMTLEGVKPLPQSALVLPPVGIELRNLLYAWQWWFFAAFIVFLWVRFIRDEFSASDDEPTMQV